MASERCPECDVELISTNGGADWICPLCNQAPRPEQYMHPEPIQMPDTTEARDLATRACELLVDLANELPEYADIFRQGYYLNKELAEMWDQKGEITQ